LRIYYAGGHLMQTGQVDLCIVGTDRTTSAGHVVNKIGIYLKALAANDNHVPFYVAAPSSSIDWHADNPRDIVIESRDAREVLQIRGRTDRGRVQTVRLTPDGSPAANPAFDVTPASLVTALITERGVCQASADGLSGLFPDRCRPASH
jgi:methylthioribose-1-phosphate isomerase